MTTAFATERRRLSVDVDRHELARRARVPGQAMALFDTGSRGRGWSQGPMLALSPVRLPLPVQRGAALERLDELVARRPNAGHDTGLIVALAFDAAGRDAHGPSMLAWSVDAAVVWPETGAPRLVVHAPDDVSARAAADRWERQLGEPCTRLDPLRVCGPPRTSLPRASYLEAVERVRASIAEGEIYQANLCQSFSAEVSGDPFEFLVELAAVAAGPYTAYVEWGESALVSVSPESFLRGRFDAQIETRPIKGTRPRGVNDIDDRRQLDTLLASEKDHAELLMIVDLERNDLSRICRPGTVRVPELAVARSYPTVHHLEATVAGTLQPGTAPSAIVDATFPGGSISGAPKIRALELLRSIEPVPRGMFTGSLFWFGDDDGFDSSILIRTVELHDGRIRIGAGGGVTWGSDPEAEWRESNDKARALTRAAGFEPEAVA